MKKIVLLFVLISSYAFSQSVNDYKYVIVPAKFNFLKKEDQHRLNTLTKLLLEKYAFKAFLSNEEIPAEVVSQRCDFLYADVLEASGMLLTKLKIVLKDCSEKVVYETEFGTSREKEYGAAYNEALRDAGKSFDKLNYKYNGKNEFVSKAIEAKTENTALKITQPVEISRMTLEPLFAKPFGENGYQLLTNNTNIPQHVMTIYKTSSPDCYLVNNGVLLKKANGWHLEYYKENKLVSELISIVNLN